MKTCQGLHEHHRPCLGIRNEFPHGWFNWRSKFFLSCISSLPQLLSGFPSAITRCSVIRDYFCARFCVHQFLGRVLGCQPWSWGLTAIYCHVFVPFVPLTYNHFVFLLSSLTLLSPEASTFLWVPKICPHPSEPCHELLKSMPPDAEFAGLLRQDLVSNKKVPFEPQEDGCSRFFSAELLL